MIPLSYLSIFLTIVFHLVLGNSVPASPIPLLTISKQNLAPVRASGGALSGAPSGQAPPPVVSTSDDEDLAAKGGGLGSPGSGYQQPPKPPPLGPINGGASGDVPPPPPGSPPPPQLPRPPPPWPPASLNGSAWTVRPTVRIELPVGGTTAPRPRPPVWPPRPTENGRSCSNHQGQVIQTLQGHLYRPECQAKRPELYTGRQCGSNGCFCVNEQTGEIIEGTTMPASRPMSCTPGVFSISLGFDVNWQESMALPSSASFHQFAQKIEAELNSLFREFQGRQTSRVLRLRPGSVIADIRLTSIGHAVRLDSDVQEMKQLLDSRVATGQFAGMPIASLKHYSFRRESEPKSRGGSNNNQEDGNASNEQPKNPNESRTPEPNNNQRLSTASLFSSPGVLAAAIAGGVGCLLLIALLIMFGVYRSRKANGGSYKTANGRGRNGQGPAGGSANGTTDRVHYTKAGPDEYFA